VRCSSGVWRPTVLADLGGLDLAAGRKINRRADPQLTPSGISNRRTVIRDGATVFFQSLGVAFPGGIGSAFPLRRTIIEPNCQSCLRIPSILATTPFHFQRMIAIAYDERLPPTYLPLHARQSHLRARTRSSGHGMRLLRDFHPWNHSRPSPCRDEPGRSMPEPLQSQRNVIYVRHGRRLSDASACRRYLFRGKARPRLVRRLTFDTGHLQPDAGKTVRAPSRGKRCSVPSKPRGTHPAHRPVVWKPSGFRQRCRGLKLIATPWTDGQSEIVRCRNAQGLHNDQNTECVRPTPLLKRDAPWPPWRTCRILGLRSERRDYWTPACLRRLTLSP